MNLVEACSDGVLFKRCSSQPRSGRPKAPVQGVTCGVAFSEDSHSRFAADRAIQKRGPQRYPAPLQGNPLIEQIKSFDFPRRCCMAYTSREGIEWPRARAHVLARLRFGRLCQRSRRLPLPRTRPRLQHRRTRSMSVCRILAARLTAPAASRFPQARIHAIPRKWPRSSLITALQNGSSGSTSRTGRSQSS